MSEHFVERRENWDRVTVLEERMNQLASKVDVQEHVGKLDKRLERMETGFETFTVSMEKMLTGFKGELNNLATMFAKQNDRLGAINEESMRREGQHQADVHRLELEKRELENAQLRKQIEDGRVINRIKTMAPVVGVATGLLVILAFVWNSFVFGVHQATVAPVKNETTHSRSR